MNESQLPVPLLRLASDTMEKIQGGEDTIYALWAIFSRVKDTVENGRRLENMSWRLWHRARMTLRQGPPSLSHIPRYPEIVSCPLSSPPLSFSSSSDTTMSSDWDRETAVGDDDDVQHALLGAGSRRSTVVTPHAQKLRGELPSSKSQLETLKGLSSALLSPGLHQSVEGAVLRELPSGRSEHAPHHQPQGNSDPDTVSPHHDPCAGRTNTDGHLVSSKAQTSDVQSSTPFIIGRSAPSASKSPRFEGTVHALITSSSVPITLPSMIKTRGDTISVGRIIVDLLPNKGPERMVAPRIVEPERTSTPVAGRSTLSSTSTSVTITPRQEYPTVVVVNPTPHPTPPATPTPTPTTTNRAETIAGGLNGNSRALSSAEPAMITTQSREPLPVMHTHPLTPPTGSSPAQLQSSKPGHPRHKRPLNANATNPRRQTPKKLTPVSRKSHLDVDPNASDANDKGKEKVLCETSEPVVSSSAERNPPLAVKPLHDSHSHSRPLTPQLQSQNLRQLPTVPPKPHVQLPLHRPATDVPVQTSPADQQPTTRQQLPFHPQLGHLGLGHLPTVPPRQRRPIEILETSSEYETTDTDDSSWESESISGGETRNRPSGEGDRRSGTTGGNRSHRTRDAGEFRRDAEREAQRARELFQKLPPPSYSQNGQLPRTRSGLSQLFHPDPTIFPEGHPYRTSHRSGDILARNWSAPGPPLAMTALATRTATSAGPVQATVNAEPVVSSLNSRKSLGSGKQRPSGQSRNGYRRRGPPQDQEQESESEENPEDTIQVSSSVAQRRLAVIMGQRPTGQSPYRPRPTRTASHPQQQLQAPAPQPPPMTRTATAPMVMNPYLLDPAPLQPPHTIRRNIIAQELDEELRRNLLWERSQNQIVGRPPRAAGSILPGPWRPLGSVHAEESRETQSNRSDRGPGQRSFATQRTKSWAGDYHASGW